MTTITFLRHFATEVDPRTPATKWELSADGKRAMERFLGQETLGPIDIIYTSTEQKAIVTAEALEEQKDCELEILDALAEMDRSPEGFIDDHDRYIDLVESYLAGEPVPVQWEPRDAVERRIRAILAAVDETADHAVAVTHGMLLTIMLEPLISDDPVPFWHDLGFGETVTVLYDDLKQEWMDG